MNIEALEHRTLRTAVVTQSFPGIYNVDGGSGEDSIAIVLDNNTNSMTVNGNYYGGVTRVTAHGYDGEDNITVSRVGPEFAAVEIYGDANKDYLILNSVNGSVIGGAGSDTIKITDSQHAAITGNEGDDNLLIYGNCAEAYITGDVGNDTIDARSSTASVHIQGGDGTDHIYGSPYGDILEAGAGSVKNGIAYGDFIYGGNGDDVIFADNGYLDVIDGGGGSDTAYIDYHNTSPQESSILNCETIILSNPV